MTDDRAVRFDGRYLYTQYGPLFGFVSSHLHKSTGYALSGGEFIITLKDFKPIL